MIKSFQHKGSRDLFEMGVARAIAPALHAKIKRQLDALDVARAPQAIGLHGWGFHPLRGKPQRYAISVTANWRITFGFRDGNVVDVDLEDYH